MAAQAKLRTVPEVDAVAVRTLQSRRKRGARLRAVLHGGMAGGGPGRCAVLCWQLPARPLLRDGTRWPRAAVRPNLRCCRRRAAQLLLCFPWARVSERERPVANIAVVGDLEKVLLMSQQKIRKFRIELIYF